MEKDYSDCLKEIGKEDDRPFWLRLLCSLRPSVFLDSKKDGEEIKRGVGFEIKGGTDF